ncbi:SGNH/GDSL hydrolase family protein [Actinoplanes flavus]|uniref:SGNH/GDSL hydrolase family protein n=1 Tax=Actinoplanes flavus TaxID=2820290 RepID=UPI0027DCD02B|nr:SGNH/GDSL hydrolase family protein [Actinoplanes flavus]
MPLRRRTLLGAASPLLLFDAHPSPRPRWTHTWTAAPQLTEPYDLPPEPFAGDHAMLVNTTLRQTVRLSLGGRRLRVRFSNAFGTTDLPITAAAVALPLDGRAGAPGIQPGSSRRLTFGGRADVTVPPGAQMISDPVDLPVVAAQNLTVTVHLRDGQDGSALTSHPCSRTTSWLIEGDRLADPELPGAVPVNHWYLLSAVEVTATGAAGLVVLGDALTDGRGATLNGNDRWPDQLLIRLRRPGLAVLNQAARGNRVLCDGLGPNALARLDRDVLTVSGARWLLVFEGVNDLGMTAATEVAQRRVVAGLIGAYQQIALRAQACGLRIFGATLTPFGGNIYDDKAGVRESARQQVNAAIRAGLFDGWVDFDAAVRDPVAPWRLLPIYDAGDHLHLNPRGYAALAAAVPSRLLEAAAG